MVKKILMPSISFIVARSYPGNVIGCEDELPWHLKSDLKRFKDITSNHAVIMGRKTHHSIGRVLPNRANIVLSRANEESNFGPYEFQDQNLFWSTDISQAMFIADVYSITRNKGDFFIIGGAEVYKLFHELVNKVYLTEVFADVKGDAFFEYKFDIKRKWKLIDEKDFPITDHDEYPSRFTVYERRERRNREKFLSQFYTDADSQSGWIAEQVKSNAKAIERYAAEHDRDATTVAQRSFSFD